MADEDNDLGGEELNELPEEILSEAKNLGWVPKDQFKGNPERWIDAQEFVENGKKITPILRANNKRLQEELLKTRNELGTMKDKLANTETAVSQLVKANAETTRRALEASKVSLKEELKEARSANDVDRELELQGQLQEIDAELKKKPDTTPAPKTTEPQQGTLSPEFIEWKRENAWYGGTSSEDKKRTKQAQRIAEDLRDEGVDLVGREFLDLVKEKLEEQEGASSKNQRPISKVEPGNPAGRGRSSGHTWADLPAEAKAACAAFDDSLVGPNKMYKTQAEWRAAYVRDYYQGEA